MGVQPAPINTDRPRLDAHTASNSAATERPSTSVHRGEATNRLGAIRSGNPGRQCPVASIATDGTLCADHARWINAVSVDTPVPPNNDPIITRRPPAAGEIPSPNNDLTAARRARDRNESRSATGNPTGRVDARG